MFSYRSMSASVKRSVTYAGKGAKINEAGKFEGVFSLKSEGAASYLSERMNIFETLLAKQKEIISKNPRDSIEITLPDGSTKEGIRWVTTPLDIAAGISKGLANNSVVAKVKYTEQSLLDRLNTVVAADEHEDNSATACCGHSHELLWDMHRPLEGSCSLQLHNFDSPEGKDTFWHSSAHILGASLEHEFGCHLTIGPPLERGFYYDGFYGSEKKNMTQQDFDALEKHAKEIVKTAVPFERLEVSKEEALELFQHNPFKIQLISTKVPDGSRTSVYRCGNLIDLCRGPHVSHTGIIKAFSVDNRSSATTWLGKSDTDMLIRVYAISFPTEKQLKEYTLMMEEAKKRDHRLIGTQQELYFFHPVISPGSCFWNPHGTIVYNRLQEFMRSEYRFRGYKEVITPNIYARKLFEISGHVGCYEENMYSLNIEGEQWFLKPMNCPGHCMVFDHKVRSYKDLPIRMASFGVLHRNEASGSLAGLTRVRRFQQDDAHIFCRPDQIQEEVANTLRFLKYVYKVLDFKDYSIALSTRPAKAIGSIDVWNAAEDALKQALESEGILYTLNPGDGAFYGPKIDVRLTDAIGRKHQCGTVQLDFNLPQRFNLQYKTAVNFEKTDEEAPAVSEGELKPGYERPVMVHRAILGSVERMTGILVEHFAGKWPLWLSPRQLMVCPVSHQFDDYAEYVARQFMLNGFAVECDVGNKTLNKKLREAQLSQFNYMAVVGADEISNGTVTLRKRGEEKQFGTFSLKEAIEMFKTESSVNSYNAADGIEPFQKKTA
jgi:threonyl-tRNA synthetase